MGIKVSEVDVAAAPSREPLHSRLAVAWQNPTTRRISPVGLLTWDGVTYGFRYLPHAGQVEGFRPLLGFPDWGKAYVADSLFPLFAQRVMSPQRPDYGRYLTALDLETTSDPWEMLARSEGRREGDSILVFPEPTVAADGLSHAKFLVHGIRYLSSQDPSVESCLMSLTYGDKLELVDDPTNPVNSCAIMVTGGDEVALGYVPDLLIDYVVRLRAHGEVDVHVARVNHEGVPPHLRLLVSIQGSVGQDYVPFDHAGWARGSASMEIDAGLLPLS